MRFIVAALALMAAPAWATNASLGGVDHAVIDFENFDVGQVITLRQLGEPRAFFVLHGVVEGDATNKYLRLFNIDTDAGKVREGYTSFGVSNLSVGGGGDYQPGHGEKVRSTIFSVDVFSEAGGLLFRRTGDWAYNQAHPIGSVGANQWQTVNLNFSSQGDSGIFLNGPGQSPFYIDNLVYSARANRVPEPDVWMMMIAGFGILGNQFRRRSPARRSTVPLKG